jgi:5'-3' exonuclease
VQINKEKIEKVKTLIRAYGATYYDAPGEADELCALLVVKKKVWACLSEDMDLFVYGCNRVLRYLSLNNQSFVLYHTKGILSSLNMTQKEFREICVLSGTDYNINANTDSKTNINTTLPNTIKLFRKYQEDHLNNKNNMSFYDWLTCSNKHAEYITDLELLQKINDMFDISNIKEDIRSTLKDLKIVNTPIQKLLVREIMKEDGFLFID